MYNEKSIAQTFEVYTASGYISFPLMRFKPRFSAVLQIFLSAEGRGRVCVSISVNTVPCGFGGISAVSCGSLQFRGRLVYRTTERLLWQIAINVQSNSEIC